MGKKFGIALIGLGVFVLALALLSRFYVYDRLAVVPLDQDSQTVSEGPGATVFDIASQEEVTLDLESVRKVVGDVDASEAASEELDRNLAIWETSVVTDEAGAVIDEDNPPLSASHDRVAFDRHTGVAVDCCDNYLSSSADLESGQEIRDTETPVTGQFYKLPFDTQKKTYKFWDGTLKDATDLQYKATEDIDGLTVYRFEQVIEPTVVAQIDAPASIFGIDEEGDVTLDRIYSNTRTLWVEPETGVIIRGQEDQNAVAEYQGQEVATLTDVVIGYNEATIEANVEEYSSLASQLKLIRVWVPLLGGAVGVLLLIIGLVMVGRSPSRRRRAG